MMTGLIRLLGLAALLAITASPLSAQTAPKVLDSGVDKPASAIFIGNSFFYYNNSLHNHLGLLLRAADAEFQISRNLGDDLAARAPTGTMSNPISGRTRSAATASTLNNNVVFNKLDRLFDLAIMMDCSQCPIHPQLKSVFVEYARKHSDTVRKHGAKPVWFMSWAYADKPEMTAELAEAYTRAANDNDAFVIPAGLAFARALEGAAGRCAARQPTSGTRAWPEPISPRRPSMPSLFKTSPVGLKYTAGLDEPTAKLLQTVAWETVQDYFRTVQTVAK